MGRKPCCDKVGLKKGPWTTEEDKKLINFILTHGQCCWRAVPKLAGLLRCGKSCRLRWTNYLRPDLKRGLLSEHEEKIVIDLHAQLGNRWSKIASQLPGRTDNEIKNHWNTHIKKKLKKMGVDPVTHKPLSSDEEHDKETDINGNNSMMILKQSTITDVTENEEQKDKCKTAPPIDSPLLSVNNGFSIDDVPLLHPCDIDILVPSCLSSSHSSIISPPSSLMSSSSTSVSSSADFLNVLEELDSSLPTFGWQNDFFWDDHNFMTNLSFFMDDDDDFDTNARF